MDRIAERNAYSVLLLYFWSSNATEVVKNYPYVRRNGAIFFPIFSLHSKFDVGYYLLSVWLSHKIEINDSEVAT